MKNPVLTLSMSSGNVIKIELYPKVAPNTVNSVIATAQRGTYNGSEFYRVVKGFVLQTGCSESDNYNMYSSFKMNGEFKCNGYYHEQPKFDVGIVGMCGLKPNTSDRTSFFIMTGDLKNRAKDKPSLDDNYAAIGKVIEGLDEVMRINELETYSLDYNGITFNTPKIPQVIKNATVETFGVEYPKPKIMPYDETTLNTIKEIGEIFSSVKNQ